MGILDGLFNRSHQRDDELSSWVGTEEEWRRSVERARIGEEDDIQQEINETLLPAEPHESQDESAASLPNHTRLRLLKYDQL